MAGPLGIFRKHQKIMLVVFGVAAMFAFVVLSGPGAQLFDGAGGGGGASEDVALTWVEGGVQHDIHRGELIDMVTEYNALTQFLIETERATRAKFHQPRAISLRQDQSQPIERRAVQTMLLAAKAEQLGIVVTTAMVADYIEDWTDRSMERDTTTQIHKNAGLSEDQLFNILRRELMAQRVRIMTSFANDVGTPAQLFQYAGRLTRKAQFEFLPIPVSQFINRSDNRDPSDDELRDFFNEWKDHLNSPELPGPGLKEPYRASVEYLKADWNEFVVRAKEKVTEEEIQQYYDDRKDFLYRVGTFGGFGQPGPVNPDPVWPPPPFNPDPVWPLPVNPDPKLPAAGAAAPKQPAGQFNVQDSTTDGSEKTKPKTTGDAADPKKTSAATKDDVKKSTDKISDDKKSDDKKSDDKNSDDKTPEVKKPEVEYEPLSKHRDEIREQLGRDGAEKEIARIFEIISQDESLTKYHDDYFDWRDKFPVDVEPNRNPPARRDLGEIAKQYGLDASQKTGMLSFYEADASQGFAKEFVSAFASRNALPLFSIQSTSQSKLAAQNVSTSFSPYLADSKKNGYLCWKIKDKLSYVPKLSEIRDRAIVAKKMKRARELAKKQAGEKAEEARDDGGKLQRAFTNEWAKKVIQPDPFSWWKLIREIRYIPFQGQVIQMPTGRMIPELNGEIDDRIKYVDAKFLETIFALKPGEVGTVFNHPQDVVYVVRMNSIDPADPQQLLTHLQHARYLASIEAYVVRRDWYQALESEFKVEWK